MNIFRNIEGLIVNLVKLRNSEVVSVLISTLPGVSGMKYGAGHPLIHAAVDFPISNKYENIFSSVDTDILMSMIKDGASVAEWSPSGSLAERIIRSRDKEFIGWLYESSGLRPEDAISDCGSCSIHAACLKADPSVIELILGYATDVNIKNDNGYTPLAYLLLNSDNRNVDDIRRIVAAFHSKGAELNPIIRSIYQPIDVPLSFELAASVHGRGDGHDYKARMEMVKGSTVMTPCGLTIDEFLSSCFKTMYVKKIG